MAVLVMLLVLLSTKPGFSQSNDRDNNTNVPTSVFCGTNAVISVPNFIKNRNSTYSDLRRQILSQRVLYARASAGFKCRRLGLRCCPVPKLPICRSVYEDFADFYKNPLVSEDSNITPNVLCGDQSASHPIVFNQVVDGFLSDLQDATPKTSNFFVASKRQIAGGNATVYVTAQCIANINPTTCQTCMNRAYDKLNDCLPNREGRFSDLGCFARYSDTPFFIDNQTMDITKVLKGHSSKSAIIGAAVGGVILIFLILLSWFLYRSWKKSKKTEQGDCINICFMYCCPE
ncbi:putative Gnk2-like domain-containing protein [Helianthus anomalus]